jgi:hypothetical protein
MLYYLIFLLTEFFIFHMKFSPRADIILSMQEHDNDGVLLFNYYFYRIYLF